MKSTAATTVIPKLDKVLSEFGVPDVVKSDNGPPLNSKEFTAFADDLGFKHRKVTLKWAHANGEVERFVRTVKKVIKTAKLEHKNCKQELNKMLRNYRATSHSTTRVASATVLFGRPMKTKLPEVTPCSDAAIWQRDQAAKAKMKEHADNKRYVKPSAIKEGDIVLVKRDETKKKGDIPYNPIPRTVIKTKGSMVTAKNAEGVPVSKNSSFFKCVPDFKTSREGQEDSYGDGPPLQLNCAPSRRYPQRARARPIKFADHVLD